MTPMEEKYTKGPWTLTTENVPSNNWGIPFQIHDKSGLVLTGTAASRTDGPESLLPIDVAYENLRLLKSAPALLEALTELLKHAGIADADPSDIDGEDHARESKARAAIHSATSAGGE